MKKLLITLLSVISILPLSAKAPIGKPFAIDTVIPIENASADLLYKTANVWIAKRFRSANDVIQLNDAETAHIIGKASIKFEVDNFTWYVLSGYIRYTIDFQAKDGRFRLKINNFSHEPYRDDWRMGLIYDNGIPAGLSDEFLIAATYKEMQKRAMPLIKQEVVDNITSLLYDIIDAVYKDSDDDW